MAVFFNGQKLVTPTTASAVNDDAMLNQNPAIGNVVGLFGKSLGGQPNVPLRFGTPDQAKAVLRGGELLDAVIKAFNPSNQIGGGPSEVIAFRVNPAVQASLQLANSTSSPVISLKSTNYGLGENEIKVKVEAGSVRGFRLTTQRGNARYSGDNVGRVAFVAQYSGSEDDASIVVSQTSVTLKAPASAAGVVIDLEQYTSIGAVVDRINSEADWSASVQDRSDQLASLGALDTQTIADAKADEVSVTANLQAVIDWFNSQAEGFVTAERVTGAGTPPALVGFTYLAGGSDGNTTIAEWAGALDAAQRVDIQWIAPITGDEAVHALVDAHVQFCSTTLRRERRAVCGTPIATSFADAKARAKAINSDLTSLMFQGVYDYDQSGKLVLLPAYVSAGLIAGMFAGVSPGTPLTNKTIVARGLEFDLLNPTETDELIESGLLCLEDTEEGYKVVQSISTWLADSKYNKREQSCGVALDYTVRAVREAVDVLRGGKAGPLTQGRAASIADTTLRELAKPEPQGPGVIVGDENSPAYRNIRAYTQGDATYLEFECSPVIPNNYMLVTVYAVPYSGSTTI